MSQTDKYSKTVKENTFRIGQPVEGVVNSFSPLGTNIIIEDKYIGLAYAHETFKDVQIGDEVTVYIKNIREDGKLDLSFQKPGYRNFIGSSTETIMHELKEAGGFLPFNDKSNPDEITDRFQMSKRVFKLAIGALYRQKKIVISEDGIKSTER